MSYLIGMQKIDLRTACKETKEAIRKTAIRMLEQGKTQTQVCELLGVNKNSVSSWKKKYQKDGIKGLKEKPKGKTPGIYRRLNPEQERQLQKMVADKMPDQLKLPFALWTRQAIKEVIEREYGVKIALRTMSDYLKRWGYSPQKPIKRAYEQNPKAVERWLKKEYPAIEARAKQEKATIHWGDETGVKNQCQYGRSYAPKGQTPVQVQTGKRLSLNMISTITNQGLIRFMTYPGSMTSEVLIKFLNRLIKSESQKIYLILDNLKVHHSKAVKAWVEKQHEKLEIFYLPSYSPERNPDEYLNSDLKYGISQKPMPKNQAELKRNVFSHMKLLQNKPERVKKYFNHEKIRYAS